jgi:hypothetical protein
MCGVIEPRIGQHAETARPVAEGILHRFARVVGDREGLDFEVADGKRRLAIDQTALGQRTLPREAAACVPWVR